MQQKNALLIIDAQYDFCNPQGALYVPGAEKDMQRLHKFILNNLANLDHICVTLDTHTVNDIAHPSFWQDSAGNNPSPFTQITFAEIEAGKWIPRFEAEKAKKYVFELEKQGQFPHFIWPEHCLIGSKGAALDDTLMQALRAWSYQGNTYQAVMKGAYPLTEHFGIFMAQIPDAAHPETELNKTLLNQLDKYENLYVAGEAKSHCVATSIKQAMDYAPELAKKMIIIEDCMCDVPNLGHLGTPIYEEAKKLGLQFVRAEDIIMN